MNYKELNCEQARELAALAASGDVTPAEERALASHVAGCGECRAEAQAFEALRSQLAWMRDESLPEPVYAAVRARVLGELHDRRRVNRWVGAWSAFAAVIACTVVLAVALHPDKTVVAPPVHQPEAVAADAGVHEEAPALAAVLPVHRIRRSVTRPKLRKAAEPLVVHMFTDDPNVVIYWIADKEIIQ